MSWTPDGAYLITPTGIYQNQKGGNQHFATYVYSRHQFEKPSVVLTHSEGERGFEKPVTGTNAPKDGKPSVAVRCSPLLYKLPPNSSSSNDKHNDNVTSWPKGGLNHRSIFAVLTFDTIYVHDTHHVQPLVVLKGERAKGSEL